MRKRLSPVIVAGLVFALVAGGVVGLADNHESAAMDMDPSVFVLENESRYDFDTTVEMIQENVEDTDWKIVNTLRLDKSVADHGYDVAKVAVMELCNPEIAAEVLQEEDARVVTSMMPCRVSVYKEEKDDDDVIVSRMNTELMSRMFGGLIYEVMGQATEETEDILEPVIEEDEEDEEDED